MKSIKLIVLFCALLILRSFSYGQDIHFSQFLTAPMSLSPATAGLFNGKFRAGLNSKLQWSSVTKPYQTISVYFDTQLFKRKYRKDAFGIGASLFNDLAGDSKFSSTEVCVSLSYIKSLNRRNNNFISVGVQPGYVIRKIDYSALSFDNQYNGSYYDSNLGNGEVFSNNGYSYFDLGAGINWLYQPKQEVNYAAGFGMFHINRPRQSFFDNFEVRLHTKYIGYFNAEFNLRPNIEAQPSILYMNQGPHNEILFGSLFKFNRNKNTYSYVSMNAGLFYRFKDALIVVAGFDWKRFSVNLSYDVNLSSLTPASKARGGFEISIVYIYDKSKQRKHREIPCPIF